MKLLETGYDNILNSNYELYSVPINELKTNVKSWYGDINFREFDERFVRDSESIKEMKRSGLICNLFFAYKEDESYYLLDGFNRLLTDYGQIDVDINVYLKILTDKLLDHQLMSIMFNLNSWKLVNIDESRGGRNVIDLFFDRGMKFFLYKKFDIDFYYYNKKSENLDNYTAYQNRKYSTDDIDLLKRYFVDEQDYSADFLFSLYGVSLLFKHVNIINDLKEIVKINKYNDEPFKNFKSFVSGYVMFLSCRRVKGDNNEHKFDTYLEILKQDKSFFKKLQGMAGNDSTRQNIYNFFRKLKK